MKMRTKDIAIASAIVMAFGASGAAAQTGTPIKLGAMLPLTGAGPIGESAQIGVELAVKEINAAGGIAGRQVQLVMADYQTDATIGVGEAKRLIQQEKVDLMVGPTYSQVTLAVMPMLIEAKIPEVNVSGTEKLTPEVAPFGFSMLANAESQATKMVDWADKGLKAKSAAIFSDAGAQAKTAVEAIKAELAKRNIKLTGVQEFQYNAKDMTPQLLDLKRGNPDVVLLFTSNGDDTGNALKGLGELGWDVKVSGSYGVALSGAALKIVGKEGFKNTTGLNYKGFSYCGGQAPSERFRDFIAKVKAFKPEAVSRLPLNYVSLWYDAPYILKWAVEGAGNKTDGPTIAAFIEQNAKNFQGVNSGLSASKQNHFLIGADALAIVHPEILGEGGIQQRVDC
jgi:branched-chain amino acid transport system substrate-binding protein